MLLIFSISHSTRYEGCCHRPWVLSRRGLVLGVGLLKLNPDKKEVFLVLNSSMGVLDYLQALNGIASPPRRAELAALGCPGVSYSWSVIAQL